MEDSDYPRKQSLRRQRQSAVPYTWMIKSIWLSPTIFVKISFTGSWIDCRDARLRRTMDDHIKVYFLKEMLANLILNI